MSKTNEDLSGPYENWATAGSGTSSNKKKRMGFLALLVLATLLGVAGLSVSVLLFADLHPLWNRPSTTSLLFLLIGPPLAGGLLVALSSMLKRWQREVAAMALLLMLPLAAMPLSPLLLYANQAGDTKEPTCSTFRVVKKEVVSMRRGVAYDLTLSNRAVGESVLRVSRIQFYTVFEGQTVWIQVGSGLFGMRYVQQISDAEMHGCVVSMTAVR